MVVPRREGIATLTCAALQPNERAQRLQSAQLPGSGWRAMRGLACGRFHDLWPLTLWYLRGVLQSDGLVCLVVF